MTKAIATQLESLINTDTELIAFSPINVALRQETQPTILYIISPVIFESWYYFLKYFNLVNLNQALFASPTHKP